MDLDVKINNNLVNLQVSESNCFKFSRQAVAATVIMLLRAAFFEDRGDGCFFPRIREHPLSYLLINDWS